MKFTFVQGLIVGPTAKPSFDACRRTLLTKKLLPVRYLPTTLIKPNLVESSNDFKKSSASFDKTKPCFSEKVMKGIARSAGISIFKFLIFR